jgi:enamine deaminase RidA (YjgF/YER057c/UK114 family)
MNEHLNPATVYKPLGSYTQTIRVPRNAEWLVIAGQVGMNRQGRLAAGVGKQAEQAFRNVLACLRANRMGKSDLVKFTVYLTESRHVPDYRAARQEVIGDDVLPTSTLVIVDGLASPDMLIEVEAWAAKA